jgi:hypothetical protein
MLLPLHGIEPLPSNQKTEIKICVITMFSIALYISTARNWGCPRISCVMTMPSLALYRDFLDKNSHSSSSIDSHRWSTSPSFPATGSKPVHFDPEDGGKFYISSRANSNSKRQTSPLVRESVPHKETRNSLRVIKIWSWVQNVAWHEQRLVDWRRLQRNSGFDNKWDVKQSPPGKNANKVAEDTGEDTGLRRLSTCCIELQNLWISDSSIVTCSYDL